MNDSQESAQVLFKKGNKLFAVGYGVYHVSENDGDTWKRQSFPLPNYLEKMVSVGTNLYAFAGNGTTSSLFTSADDGASWSPTPITGLSSLSIQELIADESSKFLFGQFKDYSSGETFLYKIDLANNSAAKLSQQSVHHLQVTSDHTLWAIRGNHNGNEAVVRYDFEKKEWENSLSLAGNAALDITANDYIFLMSDNGLIKMSQNKGKKWTDIPINVSGVSGAITMTNDGIVYAAVSNQGVYRTTASVIDSTPPGIAIYSPGLNSVDVDDASKISIEFSEEVLAQEGKTLRLYEQGKPEPFYETSVTQGAMTAKKFTFTPPNNLPSGSTIEVQIEASGFKDYSDNSFSGIARGQWSFITEIPVGLYENNVADFQLIPNPTNGRVQINPSSQIVDIDVFDTFGRDQDLVEWNDSEINLSQLANGLYIVRIQTLSELKTIRLVKH